MFRRLKWKAMTQIAPPSDGWFFDSFNQAASNTIYQTLNPNAIRLVKILPANSDDNIECELVITPKSRLSQYTALSYTWGTKSYSEEIKLNNCPYQVTKNLSAALRQLRTSKPNNEIWIDALCINQNDPSERKTQVRIMPQIYQNASSVLAWLGAEADNSKLVLDTISAGELEKFTHEWTDRLFRSTTYNDLETLLDALMGLILREYWNRLWIVQEIAYAEEVWLCCGSEQIPYSALVHFMDALKRHEKAGNVTTGRVGRILGLYLGSIGPGTLNAPGSARATDTFEDPTWLLGRHAVSKKCLDPRDRIFASYGLFSPELRARIIVDYTQTMQQIVFQSTQAIIDVTRRLDSILLKRRSIKSSSPETADLPSWLPVLDDEWGTKEIFFDMLNPKDPRSACGSRAAKVTFIDHSKVLRATGVFLGRVVNVGQRDYQPTDYMYGQAHEHVALVQYIFEFLNQLGDAVNSRAELILFWSTILNSFFHQHLVFATPRDQNVATEVFQVSTDSFVNIINYAVEMQDIFRRVESRSGFFGWLKTLSGIPTLSPHQTQFIEPLYRHFDYRVLFTFECDFPMDERQPFVVENEEARAIDVGVGPEAVQVGDVLCVLYGCKVPVILRPSGSRFRVVGDAQLSDFMNGEALNSSGALPEREQYFDIE